MPPTGPPLASPALPALPAHVPSVPAEGLAPFAPVELVTAARPGQPLALLLVASVGVYLYGVYRLRRRGDGWPWARSVLFAGGIATLGVATVSGLAAYDQTLFSAHMAQHMLLGMIAPILLALGAPVTLALRTLPAARAGALLAVLHSRYLRVATFPLVGFVLFVTTPFVLYFSGWFEASLRSGFVHEFTHLHLVAVGCLFFWPLLGLDPLPGAWPYPARALLMFLSMPIHALLGVTIMGGTAVLAGDYYRALRLPWADPAADQVLGGGLLWASGDVVSLLMIGAFVAQWIRSSEREAARVDRHLDRSADGEDALAAYNARLAALAGRERERGGGG